MIRIFSLLCLLIIVPAATLHSQEVVPAVSNPVSQAIGLVLNQHPTRTLGMLTVETGGQSTDEQLTEIYHRHGLQPFWLTHNRPNQNAEILLRTLSWSDQDGLNPDNYRVARLLTLWDANNPLLLAELDVLLTLSLGRYVADMREGSGEPCLLDPKIFASARDRRVDLGQVIEEARQSKNFKAYLHGQAPAHSAYQGLRRQLARFRQYAKAGGWPVIGPGPVIKPGMADPRLPLIARRLQITGELTVRPTKGVRYGGELVAAVKRFQKHYLLDQDGIIGKKTLAAMNIQPSVLIRKIILNMERWRWLPHRLTGRRLFVNIAGFVLIGARDEQAEITMPVIVGKKYHETPVFTASLRYLVINPYWNIPDSIAEKEIVPAMQKDPGYLRKHHIKILAGWSENAPEIDPATIDWQTIGKGIRRYRLRQDPGPENALGRIKFILPNQHNIYLHDTPARGLFKRTSRGFSHGCIRVSRPLELAEYVLRGNRKKTGNQEIRRIIDSGKHTAIPLDTPLPVHILYRTVRVDKTSGDIFFYPDIYGRDGLLARALFARRPLSRCLYPPR
jgi:murein L,D-transpeptidase YcbB/YkuD